MLRTVARPMLASMFIVGGVNSLRNAKAAAPVADSTSCRNSAAIASATTAMTATTTTRAMLPPDSDKSSAAATVMLAMDILLDGSGRPPSW